ncbi:MAG TPA: LuxR C-terminal-related transcriptional regulator [Candidatus Dormibacteraeota bacterium]|nr:LuxR C-terminal-related transcriptional regulator [Candidatus Dormibacteraeota bacterium]
MSDAGRVPAGGSPAYLRGDFAAARAELEAALSAGDAPEVHRALAGVCLVLEDVDAARRHGEAAYRHFAAEGDGVHAAAAAIGLAQVEEWTGNEAAINGWLSRARRHLESAGECVQLGYLQVARIGCDVQDAGALQAGATAALELARRFGDTDLEVRALADGGLAMVSQGDVEKGLAQLDEAMAAVVAGEVRSFMIAGTSCCAMLHACDRIGDLDRARQWIDAVFSASRARFGEPPPVVLQAHCRLLYGTMLRELGRWEEAEVEFRRTFELTTCLHYRADAVARLADLRIQQGRLAEAERLLEGFEDCFEVTEPLARLHLARDEPDLAAATLRRALRRAVADRLQQAPLLSLLVEVDLARGDVAAARLAAGELRGCAADADLPVLQALAHLGAARLSAATGGDAVLALHAALSHLADGQRPLLRAEVHLELAAQLRGQDRAGAVAEARAALAISERLGARRVAARAAALLRDLGVAARVRGEVAPEVPLSRRETEVLELLAEGLTNAQIARRLFITPKTAEHHVGAILGKLNARSRAEAAAYAASLRDGAAAS